MHAIWPLNDTVANTGNVQTRPTLSLVSTSLPSLIPCDIFIAYIKHGKVSVRMQRTSLTLGVASSVANDVTMRTRHRASTNMYSLTFRVRVTTPPQYGQRLWLVKYKSAPKVPNILKY